MRFFAVDSIPAIHERGAFYLVRDHWNDWYTWQTMRTLVHVGLNGVRTNIGSVKIGKRGMTEQAGVTELPAVFTSLDPTYFSLGQTENYYESLYELPSPIPEEVLQGLRDCAYNLSILEENSLEPVMSRSLLRDVAGEVVSSRYHRLATGNAALTPFSFSYHFPGSSSEPVIEFRVQPSSMPPSNIHVLIGRNGVGKSRCFDGITKTLIGSSGSDGSSDVGRILNTSPIDPFALAQGRAATFSGIVFVAFSAFDSFKPLPDGQQPSGIKYSYVGLKLPASAQNPAGELKNEAALTAEFINAVAACRMGARVRRWQQALRTLESDPIFQEHELAQLATFDHEAASEGVARYFERLSSGHKVVLLTITRLVELVEEKTLVLLDEPEGHLHPPLLSAFIRALSDLLVQRNGVALVATHSPVVLQEVPRECVWILNRTGSRSRVDRPIGETFGEGFGVLAREVFGLELTSSGYNELIRKAVDEANGNYTSVVSAFNGKLGSEGRAVARALCISRERS